jgi:hypothetical protein
MAFDEVLRDRTGVNYDRGTPEDFADSRRTVKWLDTPQAKPYIRQIAASLRSSGFGEKKAAEFFEQVRGGGPDRSDYSARPHSLPRLTSARTLLTSLVRRLTNRPTIPVRTRTAASLPVSLWIDDPDNPNDSFITPADV